MGKPAATINWSGSTEFMDAHNSLLIQPTGKLVPVDPLLSDIRPQYKGHCWAEVRVAEVRRVMRYAYEHRDELAVIARSGMQEVRERYSHVEAARRIYEYVRDIAVADTLSGKPSLYIRNPNPFAVIRRSLKYSVR